LKALQEVCCRRGRCVNANFMCYSSSRRVSGDGREVPLWLPPPHLRLPLLEREWRERERERETERETKRERERERVKRFTRMEQIHPHFHSVNKFTHYSSYFHPPQRVFLRMRFIAADEPEPTSKIDLDCPPASDDCTVKSTVVVRCPGVYRMRLDKVHTPTPPLLWMASSC